MYIQKKNTQNVAIKVGAVLWIDCISFALCQYASTYTNIYGARIVFGDWLSMGIYTSIIIIWGSSMYTHII